MCNLFNVGDSLMIMWILERECLCRNLIKNDIMLLINCVNLLLVIYCVGFCVIGFICEEYMCLMNMWSKVLWFVIDIRIFCKLFKG